MQPIISVVIPVYNKEKYLHRCLGSVVEQTIFTQLEVFVIDDGSTDNSFIIMQEYQQKHSNINIFRQNNAGVSATRNRGISLARGKYIYFIDADDFMEVNMLELLYKKAEQDNSEITVCNLNIYNKNTKKRSPVKTLLQKERIFEKKESIELLTDMVIGWSICNKLYHLEFIRKNNILFAENISSAEDFLFNFNAFLKVNKVLFMDKYLYCYVRMIEDSLTRTPKVVNVKNSIRLVEKVKSLMCEQKFNLTKEPYNIILALLVLNILSYRATCFMCGVKVNDELLNQISNLKRYFLLNSKMINSNNVDKKNKFKIILCQIGCYDYFYRMYYFLNKFKWS